MPTFKSRQIYSEKRKEAIRRGLRRSWKDGAHHKRFHCQPVDADTIRKRALWDRKGEGIGAVALPTEAYQIRHSTRRTDSYDIYLKGRLVCSGGKAKVGLFLGSLLP